MVMTVRSASEADPAPQSSGSIDRLAEALRAESGVDLPRAYFVEEARRRLAGGPVYDISGSKPGTELQSSACFDAWARSGHDA